MNISVKRRGMGVFAVVFSMLGGAAGALFYPATQITGGPMPPTGICTRTAFTLPIQLDTSTTDSLRGIMFVPGFGDVVNASIPLPTFNGPSSVTLTPSAYAVAAGTLITVTLRTSNSANAAGGEAFESTIVFACDTGVVSSLVSAAVPIPTMSEWRLALLALLLALAGGKVLYRRRAQF